MANKYFQFKEFTIHQDRCAMKVTTDACLFGGWVVGRVRSQESLVNSQNAGAIRILEIGTGTGLLSLMLAQKTNALIDTIEIENGAFEQANENISSSPWNERIKIHHGDARTWSFPYKYDIVISNPPFYENELRSPDEKKNLAHHGGLTLQELLSIIKKNLSEHGVFFLLLPYKRKEEIERVIKSNDLYTLQRTWVRQSPKHDYSRIMIEGGCRQDDVKMTADEIQIWNDQKQYTDEFVGLLKEYYLNL